jgi:DNA uptake protein ComE-like DNA-binding protein
MLREIKNFLHFHKRERNGIVFLILILCLLFALYYLLPFFVKPTFNTTAFDKLQRLADSINNSIEQNAEKFNPKYTAIENEEDNQIQATKSNKGNRLKPFYFNPNTVSEKELLEMGFSQKFITIFLNFRNSGKVFKNASDFERVYGLKSEEFKQVEPFLTFPESNNEIDKIKNEEISKRHQQIVVDINQADTTTLMMLKGIGPAFAKRIAMYRNKLGGFYKKEQLMEVWGIDSSLFSFIEPFVVVGPNIRKIDLNKVEIHQLKNHPYLNINVANAIIQMRNRMGRFNSIDDIKKCVILKPEMFEKLKPYLTVSNNE